MKQIKEEIIEHYKDFFRGHVAERFTWNTGPLVKRVPDFEVIRFSPGPKIGLWVYCSIGASSIEHENSGLLEFVVVSPIQSVRLVETLAMITYYHSNHKLGFGHTLPIGEPWLDNSLCENWLLSLPFPFGEELEVIALSGKHAHVAWLLPITDAERDYKINNDLEALEQLFDEVGLEYWNINRSSVM